MYSYEPSHLQCPGEVSLGYFARFESKMLIIVKTLAADGGFILMFAVSFLKEEMHLEKKQKYRYITLYSIFCCMQMIPKHSRCVSQLCVIERRSALSPASASCLHPVVPRQSPQSRCSTSHIRPRSSSWRRGKRCVVSPQ